MSDTAIKEAMDYEKQFATNNKLKSAYWEHERTMPRHRFGPLQPGKSRPGTRRKDW